MSTTSRRAILAGAAALPALSLPAVAGPHPDAELLAMEPEWQKALADADALTGRHEGEVRAYEAARAPMPDACRPRPSEYPSGVGRRRLHPADFNA